MMLTAYLFYSFFGYLSGSVLYSYLIPKYFCHVDVRTVNEDQNPGAFNAFFSGRTADWTALRPVRYREGISAGISGGAQFRCFDGFLDFRPDSARPGGRTRMAVSAACERRKGDLCLVRRAARPSCRICGRRFFWRAFYLTFSLILIIQPHNLRSIVSFSGFAVAAQISRFLPSVRLGSLLVSLVVCFRHLFSLREHETENAAFTIQSLSAKIRKKQKKE